MEPERWERFKALLADALDCTPEERSALQRETARTDPDLAIELEEYLALQPEASGFLETPVHPDAARPQGSRLALGPGARIGCYEVTAVLGLGSSGVVLEARQEDPDRLVALKVMQRGITAPVALQRFLDEAHALARLKHPGVAQVYETGTFQQDQTSVPYIAMELVEGALDMLQWARARELDLEARIELLLAVCDAVGHGHERGVVHRDLKPANVLVDRDGRVKVIDFGIARVTDETPATERLTSQGDLLGTLAYMSPEQCEGDPDAVDTRSDVYSLGVMLYELVCGRLPIEPEDGPLIEAMRRLRDQMPVRPRSLEPSIPVDLEAVVLKALEKEPARRYATAHELASDLRRLLDHQPVTARAPSLHYHARLLARRHRGTVTAIGLLLVALTATAWGLSRHAARVEARERAKAELVTTFLSSILSGARPSISARGDISLREVLVDAALRLETELADAPESRAQLHATIGVAFRELGRFDQAVEQLRKAVDVQSATDADTGFERAAWLNALGDTLVAAGRFEEAEQVLREALAIEEGDAATPAPFIGITNNHLARALHGQERLEEARNAALRSRTLYVSALGETHEAVSAAELTLGGVARSSGDLDEAELYYRSALERDLTNHGEGSLQVAQARLELGDVLLENGENLAARTLLAQAARDLELLLPEEHPDVERARRLAAQARRSDL